MKPVVDQHLTGQKLKTSFVKNFNFALQIKEKKSSVKNCEKNSMQFNTEVRFLYSKNLISQKTVVKSF